MAMDGRRPGNPRFPTVRRPELVSEGLRRELGRFGCKGFEDGGVEAGDLAGECGLRELVRALLEEEEDEEREAERERGRGKISGGRFGLGARVFDDEDGRHVATALTRRRRRPTRGRAELPV